jgi:transcriptional regulator with XRE-family HTH domain
MSTPSTTSDSFPERLKAARELRGMSQAGLADKAGLPATSISHFESGARKPSFDNLRLLSDALHVTADYLLGRVSDPGGIRGADVLARHAKNLTAENLELAEEMLKLLAQRDSKKK